MMMTPTPLFRFAYTRPIVAGVSAGLILLAAQYALSAPVSEPFSDAWQSAADTSEQTHICLAAGSFEQNAKAVQGKSAAKNAGFAAGVEKNMRNFLPDGGDGGEKMCGARGRGGQTAFIPSPKVGFMVARSDLSKRVGALPKASLQRPDPVISRRLNTAFKKRRMAPDAIRPGQEIANRMKALRPGAKLTRAPGQSPEEAFAQRRRQQLATWRRSKAK